MGLGEGLEIGEIGIGQGILFLLSLLVIAGLYFLPTMIAFGREHRDANKICVLNLFLGWTLLAWIVLCVWALTNNLAKDSQIVAGQRLAGFWIRTVALAIDYVFFALLIGIPVLTIRFIKLWIQLGDFFHTSNPFYLIKLWLQLEGQGHFVDEEAIHWSIWEIVSYIFIGMVTIWLWLRFSATPGKMITKLKVVDARTGNRLTLTQAIIRYAGYFLSSLPFALGFFWVGIDKHKQGWHDKLAGAIVIREKLKSNPKLKSKTRKPKYKPPAKMTTKA